MLGAAAQIPVLVFKAWYAFLVEDLWGGKELNGM